MSRKDDSRVAQAYMKVVESAYEIVATRIKGKKTREMTSKELECIFFESETIKVIITLLITEVELTEAIRIIIYGESWATSRNRWRFLQFLAKKLGRFPTIEETRDLKLRNEIDALWRRNEAIAIKMPGPLDDKIYLHNLQLIKEKNKLLKNPRQWKVV